MRTSRRPRRPWPSGRRAWSGACRRWRPRQPHGPQPRSPRSRQPHRASDLRWSGRSWPAGRRRVAWAIRNGASAGRAALGQIAQIEARPAPARRSKWRRSWDTAPPGPSRQPRTSRSWPAARPAWSGACLTWRRRQPGWLAPRPLRACGNATARSPDRSSPAAAPAEMCWPAKRERLRRRRPLAPARRRRCPLQPNLRDQRPQMTLLAGAAADAGRRARASRLAPPSPAARRWRLRCSPRRPSPTPMATRLRTEPITVVVADRPTPQPGGEAGSRRRRSRSRTVWSRST